MPVASQILMIRPAAFGFNRETSVNNHFQSPSLLSQEQLQQAALAEFDHMVMVLRDHNISVIVFEDTPEPVKPDALFPNNWLSTSPEGKVSVFPMYAPSRRAERREDILQWLNENFLVSAVQDWSHHEPEGHFLEGTGSMVMDHDHKLIYAAVSERTSVAVLEKYAAANNYQAIVFVATDRDGRPVYHTNVVMTLGEGFAVLCEEAIEEEWELIAVRQLLETTGHSIIPITRDQMHNFAGNMLQVRNSPRLNESVGQASTGLPDGKAGSGQERFLLLSRTAYDSLQKEQKQILETYSILLPVDIPTIEKVEGGSVRCMVAEIFLEKK